MKEFSLKSLARSNAIDPKFLSFAVKVIWERNQRTVKAGKKKGQVQKVNGVLHMDANITLADLEAQMSEAVLSKLKLIFTGSDPLSHPDETDLVENMLKNAKDLYEVRALICHYSRLSNLYIRNYMSFCGDRFISTFYFRVDFVHKY